MTNTATAHIEPLPSVPVGVVVPPRRRLLRPKTAKAVVFYLFMVLAALVVLYPAAWMVMSSFKPSDQVVANISLIPEPFTLDNYAKALEGIAGISFWTFFRNSLILAVLNVVGTLISVPLAAYAFARCRFPGRKVFFSIMVGTLLLPFHVVIIPQYIMYQQAGLVNTYFPLILGNWLAADAFFVFLMVQFVRSIPRSLDEAATIDGASPLRVWAQIILPLLKPVMVTAAIFNFIASWNDFLGPLLYLKRSDLYTLPIALRLYVDESTASADYGAQMAMAVLALLPVLLFFLIFQRYIVDGMATQGLKG